MSTIETGGGDAWDDYVAEARLYDELDAAEAAETERWVDGLDPEYMGSDPVRRLDDTLADDSGATFDKYQTADLQAHDRAEYMDRGVPAQLVELALPSLYSASARVQATAEQMLARAEGAEPGSDRFNHLFVALSELASSQGLRPNATAFGRARREDEPTVGDLMARWAEQFGTGKPEPADHLAEGENKAKEYRPARGAW